jgi:AbrB family looped-hinge helix DNA binding protein
MLKGTKCCQVDAIISIDARGQIVLPKDVRGKAEIRAGDKLLLISWESEGELCCLCLVKAAEFAGTVKEMLGPLAKEILS